jgi:hypothetical protein
VERRCFCLRTSPGCATSTREVGGVDEVELVIRELGRLHAAWWGDARLDQTPWLPMKGSLTPDQRLVVLIQNWGVLSGQAEHSGY